MHLACVGCPFITLWQLLREFVVDISHGSGGLRNYYIRFYKKKLPKYKYYMSLSACTVCERERVFVSLKEQISKVWVVVSTTLLIHHNPFNINR